MSISFDSQIATWGEDGSGWHYVRLPKDTYGDLQEIGSSYKRGFGSIKVSVTVGASKWDTSVFPDSEDKSYILFIKKAIRKAESLEVGDVVHMTVTINV